MITASLTPRQQQVCELVVQGFSDKEIGRQLGLSPRTIEDHKYQIYDALGIKRQLGFHNSILLVRMVLCARIAELEACL